jgi:hypothetical protein
MRTILLTIALLVGFASTALAGPDQQTPKWQPCDYGDTNSCG